MMVKERMARTIGMRFERDNQPFGFMSVVMDVMMMKIFMGVMVWSYL